MIKVFIIDDSATVRQVLGEILCKAPGVQVIGAAQDPLFALKRMEKDWPDVIILDVEMPRMDGLTFLKKIMSERPTPVVMCSTLTESGSATSIRALNAGAVEVVAKPKVNLKEGLSDSSKLLIHAVKSASVANMKRVRVNTAPVRPVSPKLTADAILPEGRHRIQTAPATRMVAIGTSTGGTQALEEVLTHLPANAPAIAVVQHMPEKFTRAFADRLNGICEVEIKEAEDNDVMRIGQVLIAPGGRHLLIRRLGAQLVAKIKDGPPVSRHRPSVDVLFRSVAVAAGKHALGIIMTGMGDDGAAGLTEMHDTGAITIAQNEETCVVFGMPGVAIERGAVDVVVPLEGIGQKILEFGKKQNLTSRIANA